HLPVPGFGMLLFVHTYRTKSGYHHLDQGSLFPPTGCRSCICRWFCSRVMGLQFWPPLPAFRCIFCSCLTKGCRCYQGRGVVSSIFNISKNLLSMQFNYLLNPTNSN